MDFEKLFKDLKNEILELAKDRFEEESASVRNNIAVFLENSKEKLQRWIILVEQQAITPAEFELLLQSQKDVLVMETLQKAGISKIKIGMFKNAVGKLILDKVVDKIET